MKFIHWERMGNFNRLLWA